MSSASTSRPGSNARPRQAELDRRVSPLDLGRALRVRHRVSLLLDGGSGIDRGWDAGPLVAVTPEVTLSVSRGEGGGVTPALAAIDRRLTQRRAAGGTNETGMAVLLSYDAFAPPADDAVSGLPDLLALEVDRSVRVTREGAARITVRGGGDDPATLAREVLRRPGDGGPGPVRLTSRPATSLPREAYLRAVTRVQRHIARGDVYQANLCQRFDVAFEGDPFETWARLTRDNPAPRSAFLEVPGLALASVSPETFVHADPQGNVETWPIKGTRPRGVTPAEDRAVAQELLESEKDRAELLMIVDLERNDLSRVCRAGSVVVPELAALRSFAAVHHLVACVRGRLVEGVAPSALLRACFPGGSITGAPKLRAMEILRELEPVRRGHFTGCLFWFGDDGSLDSSILIRSWVFAGGRAWLGAGGGIVADSDPEQEWLESNHKARALAAAVGFDPEEAS